MTISPFSFDALRVPSSVTKLTPLVLAATVLVALGGCDTTDLGSSEEKDPGNEASEVQVVDETFEGLDLQYEPVSLASGETFSITLAGNNYDRPVARTLHEGLQGGGKALKVEFAPLQPSSVTVRCRNEMTGTTQKMTNIDGNKFGQKGGMQVVAMTQDDPDSWHYQEDDGSTTIVYDYDTEQATTPSFSFSDAKEAVQCTHVSFALKDVTDLTPSGVRFGGDVSAPSIRHQKVKK